LFLSLRGRMRVAWVEVACPAVAVPITNSCNVRTARGTEPQLTSCAAARPRARTRARARHRAPRREARERAARRRRGHPVSAGEAPARRRAAAHAGRRSPNERARTCVCVCVCVCVCLRAARAADSQTSASRRAFPQRCAAARPCSPPPRCARGVLCFVMWMWGCGCF
jgi:hypothetical protein